MSRLKVDADLKPTTRAYLCIGVAWVFMVGYSLLLVSAVQSLIDFSGIMQPDKNLQQILIFLYGLAVVSFLGGSQIPAVFLKKKSFVVQFGFSATFGFMLLLITILCQTTLRPLNENILEPFFLNHPTIAVEYLSIPYLFMIFIDFHLSGRLNAFSWRRFVGFLGGTFLHPRRTFEEISCCRSILFSLVAVVLVSFFWIVRNVMFSLVGFVPARWSFFSFNIGDPLELVSKTTLMLPALLLLWLVVAALVHGVMRKFGGKGSYSSLASLLGFAFFPSLLTILVDLVELGFQAGNLLVPSVVFLVLGFSILLILWPLVLVVFAIRVSEKLSLRIASLTTIITFTPLFMLLTRIFL